MSLKQYFSFEMILTVSDLKKASHEYLIILSTLSGLHNQQLKL